MSFSFENLEVYKKAVVFAHEVYILTKKFPAAEIYGLVSQIRRASVSISCNIAEGSGGYHKKDFTQFLRIARGSLYECIPLLEIALKENYIQKEEFDLLKQKCDELAKMLNGLISSIEDK